MDESWTVGFIETSRIRVSTRRSAMWGLVAGFRVLGRGILDLRPASTAACLFHAVKHACWVEAHPLAPTAAACVEDLGFRVHSFGFGIQELGFRVWDS
jgi:hypothetical protein